MRTNRPMRNRQMGGGRWRRVLWIGGLVIAGSLAGCVDGCSDRVLTDGPTGQPVLPWMDPIDRDALLAAMPYHRTADLSGFTFNTLIVIQNFLQSGMAVTLEVNGQDIERRNIAGLTQEVFAITDDIVRQTEKTLGITSAGADARLGAAVSPFVIRLKNYVTEDGYIISNSNFVLAPANVFESMTFDDSINSSYLINAHFVPPSAFVIAIRKTRVDFVELDRQFVPVVEQQLTRKDTADVGATQSGDVEKVTFERSYETLANGGLTYHDKTIQALTKLNMLWLLPPAVIKGATTQPQQAPTVRLTSPPDGTPLPRGSAVSVTAEVYDKDGSITKVEFFANNVKIGEATQAPYGIAWTVGDAERYVLTATATDNDGAIATSTPVTVTSSTEHRPITPAPTGQAVLPWMYPLDRDALLAAMPFHRAADLSGYSFQLLVAVQNFTSSAVAVTLEVNGQDIERRTIAGLTQEIFDISSATILQTEQPLGFSSTTVDSRLMGRPCPFVVRLKDYVTADGYIIPNSSFVLAPQDAFENMAFFDGVKETDPEYITKGSYMADAFVVCPGAFAIVLRKTHADFIELDRELIPVNEGPITTRPSDVHGDDSGDNTDLFFKRFYEGITFHSRTIEALQKLNLMYLLPFLHQPPVVKITSPADGTPYETVPANVTITADASDPDGTISKVEFYVNGTKLSESLVAPYTASWTVQGTGQYQVVAKATDNEGRTTNSDPVKLLVGMGPVLQVYPNQVSFVDGEIGPMWARVRLTNGGTGQLVIKSVHIVKPWISVADVTATVVPPPPPGVYVYEITVDGTGLVPGGYVGSVQFISNGGEVAVDVQMTVK